MPLTPSTHSKAAQTAWCTKPAWNCIGYSIFLIYKHPYAVSDFPKWMLALAGISLLPVLLSPFYLFGAHPLGTSENGFVRFLLYLATQGFWLIPLLLFFSSLDQYRRGFEKTGITIALFSAAIAITGGVLVFA